MQSSEETITVSSDNWKCNQVLSNIFQMGRFIHMQLLLNNQRRIEPLWLIFVWCEQCDMVASFTYLVYGFISSDFRIVLILFC